MMLTFGVSGCRRNDEALEMQKRENASLRNDLVVKQKLLDEQKTALDNQAVKLKELSDASKRTDELTEKLGDLASANEKLNAQINELSAKLSESGKKAEQAQAVAAEPSSDKTPPAPATVDSGVSREQINKVAISMMVMADNAYKREEYLQVCELLLAVESLGADDAETQFRIGRAYAAGGLYDKALEHYEKALKKANEAKGQEKAALAMRLKTLNNIAVAQIRKEKHDEAEASLREAVKLDETYAPAVFNLAVTIARKTDGKAEAESLMRKYIALGGERSATAAVMIEGMKAQP